MKNKKSTDDDNRSQPFNVYRKNIINALGQTLIAIKMVITFTLYYVDTSEYIVGSHRCISTKQYNVV